MNVPACRAAVLLFAMAASLADTAGAADVYRFRTAGAVIHPDWTPRLGFPAHRGSQGTDSTDAIPLSSFRYYKVANQER